MNTRPIVMVVVKETEMKTPLRTYTPAELESLSIPTRKYLLGNWFQERQPCLLYAQTGRGKSLFAMSIAVAFASAGEVFGWKAPETLKVLYVDAEMDLADIRDRQRLLVATVENVDSEALEQNLHVLPRHGHSNKTTLPDIIEQEGRAALLKIIDELRPSVVFLDNLSTMADIKDENDAASFSPIINFLYALRERNCAVVLVHHTGKKEGNFRGSSKLAAAFESIIQLAPNNELFAGDTGFALKVDKFRGANQPTPIKVKLEVDEEGHGRWLHEGLGHRELEELVAAVRSREFCYAYQMVDILGISKGEITKRKKKAIALEMITGEEWDQCFQDARDTPKELGPINDKENSAFNLIEEVFIRDGEMEDDNDSF